ncbi:MAG: lysophospholipid acyltransferase family protein [Candidatus Binatia bacterium]
MKNLPYTATWSGLKLGCLVVRILPRRWLFALSDSLAGLGYYLFRGFRTRSITNISLALADRLDIAEIRGAARQSLRNFFRSCVEIGIALESSDEDFRREISVSGQENLEAALAKGKGAIVLSAHFGNFFLLGTRLALEGYSTYVLVNQPRNGQFAKLMDEYRRRVKQRTIHARPRREALRELHQVLRRNDIAVMIADEYRKGDGLHVPLFGRNVLARRGPATLASRTGAAVVPVCMLRQADDSLKLIIEPELELVRPGKAKAEIRENTLRVTQWLERTVGKYPDQWNWMNIRWSDTSAEPLAAKGGEQESESRKLTADV